MILVLVDLWLVFDRVLKGRVRNGMLQGATILGLSFRHFVIL